MNILTKYTIPMLLVFLFMPVQQVYSEDTIQNKALLFDEVKVHGQILRGRIIRLESQGIIFETLYGEGSITIPYSDIVEVMSHETYHIVYGDDQVAIGRLLDIKQDRVLIGESATKVIQVPVGEAVVGIEPRTPTLVAPGVACGRCQSCVSGSDMLCPGYGILGEHRDGGYAEYLAVPARNILPLPRGLSYVEAAATPLVFVVGFRAKSCGPGGRGSWRLPKNHS